MQILGRLALVPVLMTRKYRSEENLHLSVSTTDVVFSGHTQASLMHSLYITESGIFMDTL